MTDRERDQYVQTFKRIHREQRGRCAYPGCDEPMQFLAHRISKSKAMLKRYGKEVIHHRFNLMGVCRNPEHNDFFNTGQNWILERAIVANIELDLGAVTVRPQ